jgi:hypothetical protein
LSSLINSIFPENDREEKDVNQVAVARAGGNPAEKQRGTRATISLPGDTNGASVEPDAVLAFFISRKMSDPDTLAQRQGRSRPERKT